MMGIVEMAGMLFLATFIKSRFDTQNRFFPRKIRFWQTIPAIPILPTIS
jgi:hypothetical protein